MQASEASLSTCISKSSSVSSTDLVSRAAVLFRIESNHQCVNRKKSVASKPLELELRDSITLAGSWP